MGVDARSAKKPVEVLYSPCPPKDTPCVVLPLRWRMIECVECL